MLRKQVLLLVILLLILAPSYAQTSNRCDGNWPSFWNVFRAAVQKRDRKALRKMMATRFITDENGGESSIDEAFRFLDDPQIRGWAALNQVSTKGAVRDPVRCWSNPGYDHIAPPAARRDNYGVGMHTLSAAEMRIGISTGSSAEYRSKCIETR